MEQLMSEPRVLFSLAASLLLIAVGIFKVYSRYVKEP